MKHRVVLFKVSKMKQFFYVSDSLLISYFI